MWVYQEQQNLPALSAGADAPEPVEPGLVPECSAPVAETLPALHHRFAAHLFLCDALRDRGRDAFLPTACGSELESAGRLLHRFRCPDSIGRRMPVPVRGVGAAGQREDPALFLREGVSLHRRMEARGAVCPNPVSAAAHLRRCDRNALPVRPDEAYFLTMKHKVAAIISAAEGLGAAPDQFRVQTVVG